MRCCITSFRCKDYINRYHTSERYCQSKANESKAKQDLDVAVTMHKPQLNSNSKDVPPTPDNPVKFPVCLTIACDDMI